MEGKDGLRQQYMDRLSKKKNLMKGKKDGASAMENKV